MFWDEPELFLQHIHSKMKPGGLIAITHQPRVKGASHQDAIQFGNRIQIFLQKTGFTGICEHFKPMKPVSAVCITTRA